MPRIVIADCDHDTIEPELRVAAESGVELVRADCTDEDAVIAAAAGADGLIIQYAPVTARVLDSLPRLRVVSRYGVGLDTVDVDAARSRGVLVCNVPDYSTEEVSDHAIALALALLRGIPALDRGLRAGHREVFAVRPLHRLRGRTFGVIGLGQIGIATARKARAFGFTVLAHDPMVRAVPASLRGVELLTLDDLLLRSDVVSLHVPLTAATRHLLDARRLALLGSQAVVVNTCRGAVVDTEALVAALAGGRLGGAALDVTDPEPLPADHPLFAQPNVVLTPHAGWYSEESFTELKRRAAANAVAACLGRPAPGLVQAAREAG